MAQTKVKSELIEGLGLSIDTSVKTSSFTATAESIFLVDTTSAGITITLPSSPSVGDRVQIIDVAGTADSNAITLSASNNIKGSSASRDISGEFGNAQLIYVANTIGWAIEFTGDSATADPPFELDYLVVAGGGGVNGNGGGGGAGGLRAGTFVIDRAVKGNALTVTVGAGGNNGSDSSISGTGITTITASGGGRGAPGSGGGAHTGGSGGGGDNYAGRTGASGNEGGYTPPEGNDGGDGSSTIHNSYFSKSAGGGGGAGADGAQGGSSVSGAGGIGATTTILSTSNATAQSVGEVDSGNLYFAGGGGGALTYAGLTQTSTPGAGGLGGGATNGSNGAANTGGGGAGGGNRSGGSGVVILRTKTSDYSGTTAGSPTEVVEGADTVVIFKASGTFTT